MGQSANAKQIVLEVGYEPMFQKHYGYQVLLGFINQVFPELTASTDGKIPENLFCQSFLSAVQSDKLLPINVTCPEDIITGVAVQSKLRECARLTMAQYVEHINSVRRFLWQSAKMQQQMPPQTSQPSQPTQQQIQQHRMMMQLQAQTMGGQKPNQTNMSNMQSNSGQYPPSSAGGPNISSAM